MIFLYHTTVENPTTVYCDTEADVSELPTFCANKGVMPGSVCKVIESGAVYMMNSSREWIKQGGEA